MGIFDWLFGKKKKDPYGGGGLSKDYGAPKPYSDMPRQYQRPSDPAPPRTFEPDNREINLSFRLGRSKQPVTPLRDQTVGRNAKPGTTNLDHLGGTRDNPDPYTDVMKLRSNGLPEIDSLDALAELVGSTRESLLFLAARSGWDRPAHYSLRQIPKKSGGTRLLMAPMPKLKAVQRALHGKLVQLLPVHEAAHGFRKGRDALSAATPHVGKDVVISVDIENFFPSFTFRRVAGYLRTLGYGRGVAVAIANLTTARLADGKYKEGSRWVPGHNLRHPDMAGRYHPELPQGAPTSPGLANAICLRMDKRLDALARKFGATYTRYADDLTFSGYDDLAKSAGNLLQLIRQIVRTEGLRLNEQKTRIMRGGRQQRVTGVVVNQKTNVPRREYGTLKAILHNCIKHGPAGQNRDNHADFKEHLRGRIAHVSHIGPERGRKLMRMFEQIRW
ncbi:MAG: RNA-directed DNA polymerase [Planctomycetes bacterium]|nr:RNA-directed DNA polymerase [Planctomycetota bacterium]